MYIGRLWVELSSRRPDILLSACKSAGVTALRLDYLGKYPILLDVRGRSISEAVLEEGSFQFGLFEVLQRLYSRRDVCFVNVGANIGTSCLNAHACGFRDIIAFEPVKGNFDLLEKNLSGLAIDLRKQAVGEVPGKATINLNLSSIGRHSFVKNFGDGVEEVDVVKLDDVLPQRPGFLWIDTEGFELSVLRGATDYLSNHAEGLCIEITPQIIGKYDVKQIGDILATLLPFLHLRRRAVEWL
ncbi:MULTISPECIES: FkbM family methyltransferase [unclassified Sinorhizobium]|uniref:FkbM family methyltransferase n=1 Tax=unclassified Sinorhizobium TaxID=2613772 RepID=UPI0024C2B0BF|nr:MULTISPECIES: FkbM family methyltransferase [unclassified Sinorhizobium]MDK1373342.1 FkbM family methyltransferase [Sinorhizobium sp. 6-70]MDK1482219.1 FkbM family methyltransferase [Sinorhizobium sp. 6-117]